jgi:hypothetical protein
MEMLVSRSVLGRSLRRTQASVEWVADRLVPPLFKIMLILAVCVVGVRLAHTADRAALSVPGLILLGTLAVGGWLFYRWFIRPTVNRLFARSAGLGAAESTHLALANADNPPMGKAVYPLQVRARHEAAHVVTALALGHTVRQVNITARGRVGGTTSWDHREGLNLASVDAVAVLYAGPLVEATGDVVGAPGGTDDYSLLLRTAIGASITDPQRRSPTQILHDGSVLARRIVAEHRDAITALADALVATDGQTSLDADDILAVLAPYGFPIAAQEDN